MGKRIAKSVFKPGPDPRRSPGRKKHSLCLSEMLENIGYEPMPAHLRKLLKQRLPGIADNANKMQVLVRRLWEDALLGDQWATNEVLTRIFGKPTERLQVSVAPIVQFPEGYLPPAQDDIDDAEFTVTEVTQDDNPNSKAG